MSWMFKEAAWACKPVCTSVPASVVPLDMEELIDSLVSGRLRAVFASLFAAGVLEGLQQKQ